MSRIPPVNPRGWAGTSIMSGQIYGIETNPDLMDENWPKVARKMERTDATIEQAASARKDTLLSAKFLVQPGDPEDGVSRYIADKAQMMIDDLLYKNIEDIMGQLAEYEKIGFGYHEELYKYIPGFGYALVDLLDRDPTAHYRWNVEDEKLKSVTQHFVTEEGHPNYGKQVEIPADRLVLLTRNQVGHNYAGRGILRSCYGPYKLKHYALNASGMAVERWAVPTPNIIVDSKGAREAGYKPSEIEQDFVDVQNAMENYYTRQCNWFSSTPYVRVEPFGAPTNIADIDTVLQYCDFEMLKSFGVHFLALGISDTGSRAVGEVHESFFRRGCLNSLDKLVGVFNGPARPGGGIFARWATYHFSTPIRPELLPTMTHSGLQIDPMLELAERIDPTIWLNLKRPRTLERLHQLYNIEFDAGEFDMPAQSPISMAQPEAPEEPELPQVAPGNYAASNREAADLIGSTTNRLNTLVRRSIATDIPVPAIGAGRDRRWDLDKVFAWYQRLTGNS